MLKRRVVTGAWCVVAGLLVAGSADARHPTGDLDRGASPPGVTVTGITYTVTFDSATAVDRTIRVEMSFRTDDAAPVLLSLPAWTPGSYELDNFARHIRNFEASAGGVDIRWDKVDYDTWTVHPTGSSEVTVRFDYRADTMDVGMAWSAPDFAFFNGTNLFLYPEGMGYEFPARVTVVTEPGWKVATGLTYAGRGFEYSAETYHELVDMPTFIGKFELDSARIGDAWYRLATYPVGALSGDARATAWQQIQDMVPPMEAVFGETPWETYTVMAVFDENFGGGSALEHSNSHLGTYSTQFVGSPILALVVAHETFHAWNVKRMRPAEMVPYEYGHPQPTGLLWVSEGITDYYADLALVRSGIIPPQFFYQITQGKIQNVATSSPVALEDASLSTWIEPDDGTAFIYYPKGSLAGLMLDILIREATDNRASLDDVMRDIYVSTYKQGRGFTDADWWEAVRRHAGGRSFDEFYDRYIDGRAAYPWETILPLAGLSLVADTTSAPRIGVSISEDSTGVVVDDIVPGSAAADAGIRPGDYLRQLGAVTVENLQFGVQYRSRYGNDAEGTMVQVVVLRDGTEVELDMELRFTETVTRSLREDSDAPARAVRIRNGILEGTTDR